MWVPYLWWYGVGTIPYHFLNERCYTIVGMVGTTIPYILLGASSGNACDVCPPAKLPAVTKKKHFFAHKVPDLSSIENKLHALIPHHNIHPIGNHKIHRKSNYLKNVDCR